MGFFPQVCVCFLLMRPFYANICQTNTHIFGLNTENSWTNLGETFGVTDDSYDRDDRMHPRIHFRIVSLFCAEASIASFMEDVQRYECLYDKFSKDYKNRQVRAETNVAVKQAEGKYKNIPTRNGRFLRKTKSGLQSTTTSTILPRTLSNANQKTTQTQQAGIELVSKILNLQSEISESSFIGAHPSHHSAILFSVS